MYFVCLREIHLMKLKVEAGCELYDKLMQLQKDMEAANDAARRLFNATIITIDRPTATEWYPGGMLLAGQISGFVLKGGKPANWRNAFANHRPDAYMPSDRKCNKELILKLNALPAVHSSAINNLIGYDSHWGHPGFSFKENVVIINCNSDKMPKGVPDGAVEILESEYHKISEGE